MYILEGIAYKILLLHNVLNIPIYTKRVFFLKILFIFRERVREEERVGEK